MTVNQQTLYNSNWPEWLDMKRYGPASRWLRWLISLLLDQIKSPSEITTILDVGCGEGTNTELLARRFRHAKVFGTDISITGILCAQNYYQLPNLIFRHECALEYLDSFYDMVTCFEVLEHIPHWQDFLTKLTLVTKKYLMLSFPTGRMRKFEENMGHLRNFKKYEVENFLLPLGFRAVRTFYAGFPFFSPLYRELCNLFHIGHASFSRGKYGWSQLVCSQIFFQLFCRFSTKERLGDQFCGLFVNQNWQAQSGR